MGDLISRSELLKIIEDEEQGLPIDAEKYHVDKNVVDGMKASLSAIKNIVTEQPTAYDIDKIVEELEEVAYVHEDVNSFIDLEDAIEIVKRGCVGTDDVCEWKLEYDNLITSCGDYFNILDNCTEKFDFCPKCGKKIKIVGD